MATSISNNCTNLCDCLLHPFQNDAGVSQQQRVMEDLLGGKAKIDARKTADLLDYFFQLSRHINYYDSALVVSDWVPFFEKSAPFALAALIKYNARTIKENFELYRQLFEKRPAASGLQLAQLFIFYNTVKKVNNWYQKIKGSGLPVERVFESIIRDKMRPSFNRLVILNRLAAKWFCVHQLDLSDFLQNDIWGMGTPGTFAKAVRTEEDSFSLDGTCNRLKELYTRTTGLFASLFEPIKILSAAAELSLEQSILPLKDDLKKKHLPHLGLLFAFLKLFEELQSDLNGYTKKHLDFFYKEVLNIKAAREVPDQVHVIFEIQRELDKYRLAKGLLVKDGKDINKQEILFGLDDEIVVNQAQVKDTRTLYLNNQVRPDPNGSGENISILEGVYMAPDATKADGVDKDFQTDVKNFYTLGHKESKYQFPGTPVYKPYPHARLGFILASPVLLLGGGRRTINVTIACQLQDVTDPNDPMNPVCVSGDAAGMYPPTFSTEELFAKVREAFRQYYVYISEELVQEALKKGIRETTADTLREKFLFDSDRIICGKQEKFYVRENAVTWTTWCSDYYNFVLPAEKDVIDALFSKRKVFRIVFSGEKEWIIPDQVKRLRFTPLAKDPVTHKKTFAIKFKAVLRDGRPGVTFFNKEVLKEDLNTTLPLVKIELDDRIKVMRGFNPPDQGGCCLSKKFKNNSLPVSFYYFMRNLRVVGATDAIRDVNTGSIIVASFDTKIDVKVCGLKNFVVQNDESVMDVNGPVYPFGSRPDIIDYTLVNPIYYIITSTFISDAVTNGISNPAKNFLNSLLPNPSSTFKVGTTEQDLEDFLSNAAFSNPDKNIIRNLFAGITSKTRQLNLVGPSFYLGCQEIFCKKWNETFVNLNWKDKPTSFREYYKAYFTKMNLGGSPKSIFGISEQGFQINISVLQDGKWKPELSHDMTVNPPYAPEATFLNSITKSQNRRLFPDTNLISFCAQTNPYQQTIFLKKEFFDQYQSRFDISMQSPSRLDVNSLNGFIKINLQNQDFLHKDYSYVIARQMLAAGKLPKEIVEDAVYYDQAGDPIVINSTDLLLQFQLSQPIAKRVHEDVNLSVSIGGTTYGSVKSNMGNTGAIAANEANNIRHIMQDDDPANPRTFVSLENSAKAVSDFMTSGLELLKQVANYAAIIPNEPWTPIIQGMSLDYTATATIKDIDLIHLYPFKDTYKPEEIELQPTLFPVFCDEGTLFLGLEKLVPGNNLHILFQLAEATADSESSKEDVHWHYLDNNEWKSLRTGFEVLHDDTEDLTTSGIIKFALPENMTAKNTIMPGGLHWIKATIPKNAASVSETTGIHAQAMKVIFSNDEANDKTRLSQPLAAGQIAKLNEADASVKKVSQPYESFGGRVPEAQGMFYVRVSEWLRHRGRAIQKFDYERIILDEFPQIFKAKCINHSFGLNAHLYKNDFPYAPGYVITAVIPDLFQLKAGNAFEPKAPVSLLEKIDAYMRRRTSPFVRFRSMNPRYEKIHMAVTVKLLPGKDENYYRELLRKNIREFLAPWAVGEFHKLTFGQCVNRSDLVRFMEHLDYVDFILELQMRHETENFFLGQREICPKTPRSILLAGEVDVCIEKEACGNWNLDDKCGHEKIRLIDYCEQVKG